jgi:hypothetical protein
MPDTLNSNRNSIQRITAELERNGCLDTLEDAKGRFGRRITTGVPFFRRQTGNVFRLSRDGLHDLDTHTNIFRGHIAAV